MVISSGIFPATEYGSLDSGFCIWIRREKGAAPWGLDKILIKDGQPDWHFQEVEFTVSIPTVIIKKDMLHCKDVRSIGNPPHYE